MFMYSIDDPIINLLGANFLSELNILSIFIRLFLALIFAGCIGAERAVKRHAAGFRTYIIVCVGAAIVMMTNEFIHLKYGEGDIARLGAQVISGIGFLGAGTILVTSRSQVKGLTTAAGLWASASIGLALGIGFYTAALIGFIIIFAVLMVLPKIENTFTEHSRFYNVAVEVNDDSDIKSLIYFLRQEGFIIKSLNQDMAYNKTGICMYSILLEYSDESKVNYKNHKDLTNALEKIDYIKYFEEIF